jgi:hypothetical protein
VLGLATCGLVLLQLVISTTINAADPGDLTKSSPPLVRSVYPESLKTGKKAPKMSKEDRIYWKTRPFVIPEYKLIFFTFPKVACSEWKRMFMRMSGTPEWCTTKNPHLFLKLDNSKVKTVKDYDLKTLTAMMTSPAWTKAAIFREPKERVLSAFLDKAITQDGAYYKKNCCRKLPDKNLEQQCIRNANKFDSFLHFVTEYPKECFNVHWDAQIKKIDPKWWPYINVIGYQNNLLEDSKSILKMLYSNRDQSSAWDKFGITGWGAPGKDCENRTHGFMEENTASHKQDTGSHMREWYTPELEKLVEEHWAVEWQNEKVNHQEVKLFEN